jgi:hypothetical protein
MSRNALLVCHARFCAGTFFTPTPEERAYFSVGDCAVTPALGGAGAYFDFAHDELRLQQHEEGLHAVDAPRLHAVHGALQAALEMDSRGWLERCPTTGRPWAELDNGRNLAAFAIVRRQSLDQLLTFSLDTRTGGAGQQLRATCRVSDAETAALRALTERNRAQIQDGQALLSTFARMEDAEWTRRAAADVARHGLRTCALPECQQTEPQPKAFKLCGRCKAVVYCCPAHQQQDWRRHKRNDGCTAAAAAAGQ